jgi:hypothetical protein
MRGEAVVAAAPGQPPRDVLTLPATSAAFTNPLRIAASGERFVTTS